LSKSAPNLNPKVLQLAISSMQCALNNGVSPADKLSVIDYSLASTKPRLWIFDLKTGRLLFNELVAHGKNSGENYATQFSNQLGSLQSSLGLFLTKDTTTAAMVIHCAWKDWTAALTIKPWSARLFFTARLT